MTPGNWPSARKIETKLMIAATTVAVAVAVSIFWLGDKFQQLLEAIARVGAK